MSEEREPDVELEPAWPDEDPNDVYEDPEMGDMRGLPPESFRADLEDTDGAEDKP